MYKLIAADLDGTLLKSDKTLSSQTVERLSELSKRGVLFVPSTGRTHIELPDVIRELPFLEYAITCNGGGVYDFKAGRYIFDFSIDRKIAAKVAAACKELPVYPTMVCEGERFIQTDENGDIPEFVVKHAAGGIVEKATASPDLSYTLQEIGRDAQKFLLYPQGTDRTAEVVDRLRGMFPELLITTSGPLFVEVNAPGIEKGKTLKLLCDHLNIAIEKTIAFGDAANDISMLKVAGYAVVPANGTDETKGFADEICESCDDDGVRRALERIFVS